MRVYPINVVLEGKKCAVVGGGQVAARKVLGLLEAGGRVTVISPQICDTIKKLLDDGEIDWVDGEWRSDLADGNKVIVVATDDDDANRRAAQDARDAGVLCNVADVPEECDFILPSVFRRGPVTVAVGTGGRSPALAAHLRRRIQQVIGKEYGIAAEMLGKLRKILENAGVEPSTRKEIFTKLVATGLAEKLKNDDRAGAEKLLKDVAGQYVDTTDIMEDPD